MTTPAAKAVALAKSGFRNRLDPSDVRPGCIAWMPWASVIKVTHRDFHKGNDDGVSLVWDVSTRYWKKSEFDLLHPAAPEKGGLYVRPNRRAWNHPCLIYHCDGDSVWVLGITSFGGQTLFDKLRGYPEKVHNAIRARTLPIGDAMPEYPVPPYWVPHDLYEPLTLEERGSGKGKGGVQGSRAVEGYLKLGTCYKMDWRDLQACHGGTQMLDQSSVDRLKPLLEAVLRPDYTVGLWELTKKRTTEMLKRKKKGDKSIKETVSALEDKMDYLKRWQIEDLEKVVRRKKDERVGLVALERRKEKKRQAAANMWRGNRLYHRSNGTSWARHVEENSEERRVRRETKSRKWRKLKGRNATAKKP